MATTAPNNAKSCDEFEPFIDAYIDDEFGARESADMEAHLDRCQACRGRVQARLRFREQLRSSLSGDRAPEELREQILASLSDVEQEGEDGEAARFWQRLPLRRAGWIAGPLAAAVALVVVVPEFTVAPAASSPATVIDSTVDWHQGNFPLEVTTADRDEAQRWFDDKVDFSVRLPQFDDDRVNLLGGRIAHVEDQRAAFLLYEVDGARLSAMVFDGEGMRVPRENLRRVADRDIAWLNQKGYGVALMQDAGVTYALTSDLPEERFLELVGGSPEDY